MIRIIAKLFAVSVALAVSFSVQASSSESVAFVSATGGGTACTQTAPCATIEAAVLAVANGGGGRILCATPVVENSNISFNGGTFVFDCPSASWISPININGAATVKFQHMGFSGLGLGGPVLRVGGSGALIFEDCVLEDSTLAALDIEPNGPFILVVTNSRMSNNGSGVLIKPAAGGSVTATFSGVTIVDNAGGGIKTDSTNGPVTVDISNSTITKNAGNGLNAVGGNGGSFNTLNLSHDVIASNGLAGIQANGSSASVFVDTTLLDFNPAGATLSVAGGNLTTYGNNRIIGVGGSGFTGSLALK
jgi:hypothetical protein